MVKKSFIVVAIVYLSFGFVFAVYAYSHDVRTFRCGNSTMGTKSFKNPDPSRCVREGMKFSSLAAIPFFTVFGVPMLIARSINGNN